MKKIFFIIVAVLSAVSAIAQTGDMRTFAAQTQITLQRNPFNPRNNAVGTQYLYPTWVHGTLITNDNQKFADYWFNFNKMGQDLYRVREDSTVFLIDKAQIKSLALSDGQTSYEFEKIPAFKSELLYRVLAKGAKYSLYSFTKTKFIPSNYTSNGIVSSGNMYDEFKDEVSYYIVTADGAVKPVVLKKKSVAAALEADKPAVEKYFKDHSDAELNETFLQALVSSLNS